ncbi:MAG: SRPBCC family protein [Cellvibrionaceae bacterium]
MTLTRLVLTLMTFMLMSFPISLKAHEVRVSVVVDLPSDRVWDQLRDYSLAHNYVEGLTSTEITSKKQWGEGASRKVYFGENKYNNETVIEWRDGEGFTMRLHQDNQPIFPFSKASFQYQLTAMDRNSTLVTMTMRYKVRWGWLGERMNDWMIRSELNNAISKVAAGFKHYYEAGVRATDEDRSHNLKHVSIIQP